MADTATSGDGAQRAGTREPRGSSARRNEILEVANAVIATAGLKASLQDIADAAGILPGSLYFHFESKERLLTELAERYHAELTRIGEAALLRLDERNPEPVRSQLIDLGRAIARTAFQHRAALQLSFYDSPGFESELLRMRQRNSVIQQAVAQTIRAGRWSGLLRSDLDIATLADYFYQNMLRVGLEYIRRDADGDDVASELCRIILNGLAAAYPTDETLDRSAALAAAQSFVKSWEDGAGDNRSKEAHILAAARSEFGRRGYESTTIRDVAAAAEVGQSTVYRLIGSKENLLVSIMQSFGDKVGRGWSGVLEADSSPVEKLDALSWLSICAVHRYPDEFRIQLAWLRQSPPDTLTPGWSFDARIQEMKALLDDGIRDGHLVVGGPASDVLARQIIGLQWMPENILWEFGVTDSLHLNRDTVLRGIADRGRLT